LKFETRFTTLLDPILRESPAPGGDSLDFISVQGTITIKNATPPTKAYPINDLVFSAPENNMVPNKARPKARPMNTAMMVAKKSKAKIIIEVSGSTLFDTKILEMVTSKNPKSAIKTACCKSVEAYPATRTVEAPADTKVLQVTLSIPHAL
jgi:hypothetical protein